MLNLEGISSSLKRQLCRRKQTSSVSVTDVTHHDPIPATMGSLSIAYQYALSLTFVSLRSLFGATYGISQLARNAANNILQAMFGHENDGVHGLTPSMLSENTLGGAPTTRVISTRSMSVIDQMETTDRLHQVHAQNAREQILLGDGSAQLRITCDEDGVHDFLVRRRDTGNLDATRGMTVFFLTDILGPGFASGLRTTNLRVAGEFGVPGAGSRVGSPTGSKSGIRNARGQLVGSSVEPFTTLDGTIIEKLPISRCLEKSENVLEHELAGLSAHFEGVEFGLLELRSINGNSVDRFLLSGRPGEIGSMNVGMIDCGRVTRFVHTHPNGSAWAGSRDLATISKIGEGFVVLPDGSQFRFTPNNVNTLLPPLRPGQTIQDLLREQSQKHNLR